MTITDEHLADDKRLAVAVEATEDAYFDDTGTERAMDDAERAYHDRFDPPHVLELLDEIERLRELIRDRRYCPTCGVGLYDDGEEIGP